MTVCCFHHAGFFLGLSFDPEDGGDMLIFSGLHWLISQKMWKTGVSTEIRTDHLPRITLG
jgi:hypothetical protein